MRKFYNVFDEEIKEKLLKMPVRALGLHPVSLEAIGSVGRIGFGMRNSSIVTVKDVLKRGKGYFEQLFSREAYFKENPQAVRELEEKLMKIGFKFEDSDFSPLDVRVSELKLDAKTKAFLGDLSGVVTLADLSIRNPREMANKIHDGDYSVILNLRNAMEQYGVKFADAKYDLDKRRMFPISDKIYYMDEKVIDDYLKNYKPPRKTQKGKESFSREMRKKIDDPEFVG